MADIIPFAGLRYNLTTAGAASDLIAPPYDVISPEERSALAEKNPFNIVHLILPESNPGVDKYAEAGARIRTWVKDGVMQRDEAPLYYLYHQRFKTPDGEEVTRRGFICRIRLQKFSEGVVLPHERTLSGPKADRLMLKRATRCHLSQVFGLYSDPERKADTAFDKLAATEPLLTATTSDGVHHKLWGLSDPAAQKVVTQALADKKIYIADGHHRYETMLALREELRQETKNPNSAIEYGSIFLANMEDPGLLVFPTHRVVEGLPSFDLDQVLQKAGAYFDVEETVHEPAGVKAALARKGEGTTALALAHRSRLFYLVLRKDIDLMKIGTLEGPLVVRQLDVSVLHGLILEGILGIDRQAQAEQKNLRYIKDTGLAMIEAQKPSVQAVFLMNPTPVHQVKAVSDAGHVLPQKSTYFFPKLASGLVLNPLIPEETV